MTVGDSRFAPVERRPSCVLGNAAIAPVNWDADLIRLLAVDQHRLDAPGDHRFGDVAGAGARHLDPIAALDAQIVGEIVRDLDERFRHELHVHRIVLRPVVVVLRQPVRGAHDVESLARRRRTCRAACRTCFTTGLLDCWDGAD